MADYNQNESGDFLPIILNDIREDIRAQKTEMHQGFSRIHERLDTLALESREQKMRTDALEKNRTNTDRIAKVVRREQSGDSTGSTITVKSQAQPVTVGAFFGGAALEALKYTVVAAIVFLIILSIKNISGMQ